MGVSGGVFDRIQIAGEDLPGCWLGGPKSVCRWKVASRVGDNPEATLPPPDLWRAILLWII